MVGHHVARALVHRVVVYQILLVARQSAVAVGSADESAVHGAVPQAGLHHAALVVLALAAILLVGTTEDERTRAGVHRGELVATNIQTAIVEGQHAIGLIQYHSHLVEAVLADGSVALEGLVVNHGLQLEVAGKPQLQFLSVGAVREKRHFATGLRRLHHHVDGQVLIAEVALGLALNAGRRTIELHAYHLRQVIVVNLALHLEVGDGAQVIVLDILREVEYHVVASRQQAALWFGRAEQLWASGILDTADNLRRCGEEVVAVAAEYHGSQVILFLNHPSLAVELGCNVTVLRHQLTYTVGTGHQRRVGIERAEVGPRVVATLRLLVLELNVVEVMLVAVEAVDGDRYVPATLRILLGVGVQYPLVARCCDGHRSGLAQEVHVE